MLGEKNHMYGKTHGAPALEKIRAANLGRIITLKERVNKSAGHLNKKTLQNSSGFVGVSWHSGAKKWTAWLGLPERKPLYLGIFSKIEDAVFVRNLAFDKYYGNI